MINKIKMRIGSFPTELKIPKKILIKMITDVFKEKLLRSSFIKGLHLI